tara:strand:+ start:109 stop:255 length:147 start_codon:yes stop_codon:yes gene_type:complete
MSKKGQTLDDRIENLKLQQEEAKNLFMKIQGAIELLELMKKEKNEKTD